MQIENTCWEVIIMAKTASGRKWKRFGGYTRADGTKVREHCRSTPRTCKGKKK